MDRDVAIEKLIETQVDLITRHGCGLWLLKVLECGFSGFANMSDEQLRQALNERGLTDEFENCAWLPDAADDESPVDDEDVLKMCRAGAGTDT